MGKKDALAQGARKASFAVGGGHAGDEVQINPGIVSTEGRDTSFDNVKIEKSFGPRKRFIPLGTTLLVRRAQAADPSGLLLTEQLEQEAPAEGTVLAAGPEAKVTIGDYVVFGKYAGAEFKLNGETLLLMESTEIKGTLVEESESYDANDICTSIGRA